MRQVLVLEDEVLLAMELETELQRAGFSVLGPFVRVRDALLAIAQQSPDLAILDINLEGELSIPIAEVLLAARVPFLTLTGYSEHEVPPVYRSSPIISKPYDIGSLLEVLEELDRPSIGYSI
jgi:DNA-binding response OmpR family regulator